jgi:hypothetical protein
MDYAGTSVLVNLIRLNVLDRLTIDYDGFKNKEKVDEGYQNALYKNYG